MQEKELNSKQPELRIQPATRDPFIIPEGYFGGLKEQLLQKIQTIPQEPSTEQHGTSVPEEASRSKWQTLQPYLYLAAMFVGLAIIFNVFSHLFTSKIPSDPSLFALQDTDSSTTPTHPSAHINEMEMLDLFFQETSSDYQLASYILDGE